MSKIIIDTKILPIKVDQVEFVLTGAVGDISRETMIKLLESADTKKNEKYVDFIKRQADAKKAALDLLKLVLGLSTKQIDKINSELEESTIDNYVGYVESLLQGLATGSYADFEKAQKMTVRKSQTQNPTKTTIKTNQRFKGSRASL